MVVVLQYAISKLFKVSAAVALLLVLLTDGIGLCRAIAISLSVTR